MLTSVHGYDISKLTDPTKCREEPMNWKERDYFMMVLSCKQDATGRPCDTNLKLMHQYMAALIVSHTGLIWKCCFGDGTMMKKRVKQLEFVFSKDEQEKTLNISPLSSVLKFGFVKDEKFLPPVKDCDMVFTYEGRRLKAPPAYYAWRPDKFGKLIFNFWDR